MLASYKHGLDAVLTAQPYTASQVALALSAADLAILAPLWEEVGSVAQAYQQGENDHACMPCTCPLGAWYSVQSGSHSLPDCLLSSAPSTLDHSQAVLQVLFRGLLLPCLARMMPLAAAVLLTALLFSALHLSLASFLPLFLVSSLFGGLYAATRNLATPIVAHCLWNALQFAVLASRTHTALHIII